MAGDSKLGRVYIDVNDIVGEVLGPYKVLEYVGKERLGGPHAIKGQPVHRYKVQCTKCGAVSERIRGQIVAKRSKECMYCSLKSLNSSRVETTRMREDPNSDNLSTGIKRYSIYPNGRGKYKHDVECTVDGVRYRFVQKNLDSPALSPECVSIAVGLNKAMSRGKQAFLVWLSENFPEKMGKSVDKNIC